MGKEVVELVLVEQATPPIKDKVGAVEGGSDLDTVLLEVPEPLTVLTPVPVPDAVGEIVGEGEGDGVPLAVGDGDPPPVV